MKTSDYLSAYVSKKEEVKKFVTAIRFMKMVAENIADLVPETWHLNPMQTYPEIDIIARDSETVTVEDFKKLTSKLAKAFGEEPSVFIDEHRMLSRFYIYPREHIGDPSRSWGSGVCIEIQSHNAEKCEITYKRKMQKVPVLTGYCKALSEKNDWAKVN